eukprot:scaffold3096_cov115-Isochrysis_galbana.AAC.2
MAAPQPDGLIGGARQQSLPVRDPTCDWGGPDRIRRCGWARRGMRRTSPHAHARGPAHRWRLCPGVPQAEGAVDGPAGEKPAAGGGAERVDGVGVGSRLAGRARANERTRGQPVHVPHDNRPVAAGRSERPAIARVRERLDKCRVGAPPSSSGRHSLMVRSDEAETTADARSPSITSARSLTQSVCSSTVYCSRGPTAASPAPSLCPLLAWRAPRASSKSRQQRTEPSRPAVKSSRAVPQTDAQVDVSELTPSLWLADVPSSRRAKVTVRFSCTIPATTPSGALQPTEKERRRAAPSLSFSATRRRAHGY